VRLCKLQLIIILCFILLLLSLPSPYLLSSQFYRWTEIGDITTVGSYYKPLPCCFTGLILRRPFLSLSFFMSERLITLWLRDWLIDWIDWIDWIDLFDWIHLVWEIDYIMFWEIDYIMFWEIDYIMLCYVMLWEIGSIIFIYQISQNMYIPPSILTPRLRRLLRLYILTAVTPDLPFIILLVGEYYPYLLSSQFYRWAEIGDITTVGSYYKPLPRSSLRPLLRLSYLTATFFISLIHVVWEIWFMLFERFDSCCLRDLIHVVWEIWFILFERLFGLISILIY